MIFFTILKPCRIGPKHQFVPSCPFLFQNQKSKIKININNWYRTEASICPTISSLSISKSKIKININKRYRTEASIDPTISSLSISKSKIKININNWYRTEASICPTSRQFLF